nr:MAG TPA: hypothetical protein [Caudoviricetes sp.]
MIAYNNNYNMPARFFQVFGLLPKHQNFPHNPSHYDSLQ